MTALRQHHPATASSSAGPLHPASWTTVRLARPARDLAQSTRFYRDLVGLPLLGGFENHDGYDGVFFALPAGVTRISNRNPYWNRSGLTFLDPAVTGSSSRPAQCPLPALSGNQTLATPPLSRAARRSIPFPAGALDAAISRTGAVFFRRPHLERMLPAQRP